MASENSNLASYQDVGSQKKNKRTKDISKITVHHAAGVLDMPAFSSIMNSDREVSWNYAIAKDGTIGLFIPEKYRAWTSSSEENDNVAVTIEVSNSEYGSDWAISKKALDALYNLCEDICRRRNIKAINYTGDASGNLTKHSFFKSTACPGPFLGSKFSTIQSTVNTRLGSADKLQYITDPSIITTSASSAAKTGTTSAITAFLDYTQITPYIATLDHLSPDVNFSKLESMGVVGLMIEAGGLYDSIGMQKATYKSSKLDSQISKADLNKLPYAVYADVRAKSKSEAQLEISQLSSILRMHSPRLGVWLKLGLRNTSTNVNTEILSMYRTALEALGFKSRIGLYCTKQQLNKVNWSDICNDWYLWIIKHVDDVGELNQILTPEFFVT